MESFVLLYIIALFQIYLQGKFGVFQLFDEFLAVSMLFVTVFKFTKLTRRSNRDLKNIIICCIVLLLWGLLATYTSKLGRPVAAVLTDIASVFKVFIVYVGSTLLFASKKKASVKRFVTKISLFLKGYLIILLILAVANIFVDFGMRQPDEGLRYGFPSFAFIFWGAGSLSMTFYLIIPVIILYTRYKGWKKSATLLMIASLVWMSTLRSRAFLFVLLTWVMYYFIVVNTKRIKFNWKNTIVAIAIGLLVCWPQFELYFGRTDTARMSLLVGGINTLKSYFPFGAGFASFGTDAAAKYYSPLYYKYGFDYLWGMTADDPRFLHDAYWPAILGEFGIVGFCLICMILFFTFRDIYRRSLWSKESFCVALFVIVTQIAASLATSVFFHFFTVSLFFFIPLLISKQPYQKKKSLPSNNIIVERRENI